MASVSSGRYDPELLKQDVQTAKLRVLSLRQELMQIRKEVSIKQQGLNTLAQVEQKMSTGSCYTMGEAQAIMNELRSIQRSLLSGEKERMELMQCLARHKEDLTRLQSMTKFPDIGSSLGNSTEKLSTASQTDLSGDVSKHKTKRESSEGIQFHITYQFTHCHFHHTIFTILCSRTSGSL